jgi:hypothetical protein
MIWLTLRQFRTQGLTALALLAAAATYFLVTGLPMRSTFAADQALCAAQNTCATVMYDFHRSYGPALTLFQYILFFTPALIGVFWGAPLIVREFETGTYQLAWNQSVTRARWLIVKLAIVGTAASVTAGLLSVLLTWWSRPLELDASNRFESLSFTTRDVVPFASAGFAIALGVTVGAFMGRSVAAMAITLALAVLVQILMPTVIRPHLLPATTATFAVNETIGSTVSGVHMSNGKGQVTLVGLTSLAGAWVVDAPPIKDSSGRAVAASDYPDCFPTPFDAKPVPGAARGIVTCLSQYNLHESVTYQPANHYWPLQWSESGVFLALAALLSGSSFWWLRRRQV